MAYSLSSLLILTLLLGVASCGLAVLVLIYALSVSQHTEVPKWRKKNTPTHLLAVLGSGGHTAEMFSMLRRMKLDPSVYTHRTYVVSSGDNFSAEKAVEFETTWLKENQRSSSSVDARTAAESYSIVTVPRARRVHQSYLTAPFSTIQCFWSCILVLCGCHADQKPVPDGRSTPYPDVILTNGPATAVCMILAAKFLRLCHYLATFLSSKNDHHLADPKEYSSNGTTKVRPLDFKLRTIYVESWARVKTLSMSGILLLPLADRFLVQWPALAGKQAWRGMRKTEYVGALVD